MANINLNSKKNKIIGSALLAVIVVLFVLLVVPIIGSEQTGMISTGGATRGGQFGIHNGVYQ